MPDLKPKDGVVAFFDILGYQSFLDANAPEDATNKVLSTLLKLDEEIKKRHIALFGEDNQAYVSSHVSKIKWLVFSDTILVTASFDDVEAGDDAEMKFRWLMFLTACSLLLRFMFDFGLPLRGAVETGKFIVEGTCFSGTPIVEAYRLSSTLDLAACVLSANASKVYNGIKLSVVSPRILIPYLVPFKDGSERKCDVIMPSPLPGKDGKPWTGDIRQLVLESFWAHHKDIPISAGSKVSNTETLMRYFVHTFGDHLQ